MAEYVLQIYFWEQFKKFNFGDNIYTPKLREPKKLDAYSCIVVLKRSHFIYLFCIDYLVFILQYGFYKGTMWYPVKRWTCRRGDKM